MFFFGPILREKGAFALFGSIFPEAVVALVDALKDENEKVRIAANHSLTTIQGPAVNKLCEIWEKNRDEFLERIIRECDYFAETPKRLRYITYLIRDLMDPVVDADAEGIDILIMLIQDKDQRVADNSKKALRMLTNPDGIDQLCALWEKNRDKFLEQVILDRGYIANKPPVIFFKSSYLHGICPESLPDYESLTSCLLDPDESILNGVIAHELSIEGKSGFNRMWEIAMQHPESRIPEALLGAGFFPDDAQERALFYFLAGSSDQYHDIDFDQSILRAWYENGERELKESIARQIRQSGDARLLSIFRTSQGTMKKSLSAREVEVQVSIMKKNMNFSGLFDLLAFASYDQAMQIMSTLKEAGWFHPDPRLAELQARLEKILTKERKMRKPSPYAYRMFLDFRPMFFGDERSPSEDKEILAWSGDEMNFLRRSAGLVLMAEKGLPELADAANSACGDSYWQVRMAAAVSEILRPGTLSQANRAILSEDHVFWVQAILKLPVGGRLSELGPAGLEMLRQDAEFSGPDSQPAGPDDFMIRTRGMISDPEREYLLLLGEYFSTEGEFSEEGYLDAGMSDVEVIFEE